MTFPYSTGNVHDSDSIFEDVFVYGKFNYDFTGDSLDVKDLFVSGLSTFVGVATFRDDVFIDGDLSVGGDFDIEYLNVFQRLNVGAAGSIFVAISTTNGRDGEGQIGGRVGVGTTQPLGRFQVGVGGDFLDPFFPIDAFETALIVTDDGSVGIGLSNPLHNFMIERSGIGTFVVTGDAVTGIGSVGIGSTQPGEFVGINRAFTGPVSLDVNGPIRVDGHIYDSGESPGVNGYYMNMDHGGIRWISASPVDQLGILVQDEGVYIPNPGTAQTFSVMNYVQLNSLGLGTDTTIPIPDPDNPTMIARIQTQDLWGYTIPDINTPIYRMTKVGVKNNSPDRDLDIDGTLRATLDVDFDAKLDVDGATTLNSTLDVDGATTLNSTLDVDGATTLNNTLDVDGATTLNDILDVDGNTDLHANLTVDLNTLLKGTLDVNGVSNFNNTTDATSTTSGGSVTIDGGTAIALKLFVGGDTRIESTSTSNNSTDGALRVAGGVGIGEKLNVAGQTIIEDQTSSTSKDTGALIVEGGVGVEENVNVGGNVRIDKNESSTNKDTGALVVKQGGVGVEENVNVGGNVRINANESSTNKDTGALVVQQGGVGIEENLNVGQDTKLIGTLELENSIIDKLNSVGYDVNKTKNDYRLSAIGAGVSWRPSGVDTENAIWVTVDGDDNNSGFLEGDAKRTIGAAASIAQGGDTIIIRSGTYVENNPIGLRTDVSVSGEDLRLVTIVPQNRTKDVFHVRRGCLIQNLNFSGPNDDGKGGVSYNHPNCGAVAFPPTQAAVNAGIDFQAVTGFTEIGPANEGISGRWRSPYIRNCTNFMTGSIGMKIDGDYANANFTGSTDLGQDLKSMVCDSFTQYNENGIGVSLSNNAYAQLVSIFTIATDIGISCVTGGQCDLTNSNSSFGNVGLKADGIGRTEFTGQVFTNNAAENDSIAINDCKDSQGRFRKPFDGQGLFFKINLADYNDTTATGVLNEPMKLIRAINVIDGGLPGDYNPAAPPIVTVPNPLGPEAIIPEFSANVSAAGTITSIDVLSSGRNFLPNQSFTVNVSGGGNAQLEADTDPILFTVAIASEPTITGLTTITFNEFIPYKVNAGVDIELRRISRIITSSHSFEYIGAGTDINKANPFQGGVPITENEVIAINGGQVPFTSTDQKGNFRIGEGLVVDQTTSTIRGRDFNRAIQAQLTPLILALR